MTTVRLNLDRAAVDRAVGALATQAAVRAAGRTRDGARANLTAAGRVDTGRLRNATVAGGPVRQSSRVEVPVRAMTDYAGLVHRGTGIYGPAGRPIVPRRARVLRFRPKGSGAFVFARSVRGMRPTPFLRDALRDTSPADFT